MFVADNFHKEKVCDSCEKTYYVYISDDLPFTDGYDYYMRCPHCNTEDYRHSRRITYQIDLKKEKI